MKIYIHRLPGTLTNEIFIVNEPEHKGGKIGFISVQEDGTVLETTKDYDYGVAMGGLKPAMILPETETRALVSAFVEYAKEQGFKMHTESKAEGKLEAMGSHLQDLRTLLKLNK